MQVLFLDIDGVLNSQSFTKKNISRTMLPDESNLDPDACLLLQDLLNTLPDLKIVVSSTWRKFFKLDELKKILKNKGIQSDNTIIDYTPVMNGKTRGVEIKSWLENNPQVTDFAIIDDDNDMGELTPYLIQTDFNIGLSFNELFYLKNYFMKK